MSHTESKSNETFFEETPLSPDALNSISKTLFIPLYGKAFVSRQGLLLDDPKAEEIWASFEFPLKGKSKSKWLAYYMAMRSRVFDDWTRDMLAVNPDALVLHLGCGLDDRHGRAGEGCSMWIDADLPEVITERRRFFSETDSYRMMGFNAVYPRSLEALPPAETAIVAMEALAMYLTPEELNDLLSALEAKYDHVHILMDPYTDFGARVSKLGNPVKDVGVTQVNGFEDISMVISYTGLHLERELDSTPPKLVVELPTLDRLIFKAIFAGSFAKRIYRLHELSNA